MLPNLTTYTKIITYPLLTLKDLKHSYFPHFNNCSIRPHSQLLSNFPPLPQGNFLEVRHGTSSTPSRETLQQTVNGNTSWELPLVVRYGTSSTPIRETTLVGHGFYLESLAARETLPASHHITAVPETQRSTPVSEPQSSCTVPKVQQSMTGKSPSACRVIRIHVTHHLTCPPLGRFITTGASNAPQHKYKEIGA